MKTNQIDSEVILDGCRSTVDGNVPPKVAGPTPEQFANAELRVRREIDRRVWGAEDLRMLSYFVENSFPQQRIAAYFKSFRQLGRSIEMGEAPQYGRSHAHEAFTRLLEKKVLKPLGDKWPGWYTFNLVFSDWPENLIQRSTRFAEQPALTWEPELREVLTELLIEDLPPERASEYNIGHDSAASLIAQPNIGTISPPVSLRPGETMTHEHWDLLKRSIDDGSYEQFCQSDYGPIAGYSAQGNTVPLRGTPQSKKTFPDSGCSEKRNTKNINTGAELNAVINLKGTPPASRLAVSECSSESNINKSNSDNGLVAAVPFKGTSVSHKLKHKPQVSKARPKLFPKLEVGPDDLKSALYELDVTDGDDRVRELLCVILGDDAGQRDARKWINRRRKNRFLAYTTIAALVGRLIRTDLEKILKPGGLAEEYWKDLNPIRDPDKAIIQSKSRALPVEVECVVDCELPHGFPRSLKDALTQCSSLDLPDEFINDVWNKAMYRGGLDCEGMEILSFCHYVFRDWKYKHADQPRNPFKS